MGIVILAIVATFILCYITFGASGVPAEDEPEADTCAKTAAR